MTLFRSRLWDVCRAALAVLMLGGSMMVLPVGMVQAEWRPPSTSGSGDAQTEIDSATGRITTLGWGVVGAIAFVAVVVAAGAFMADRPDIGKRILIGIVIGIVISIAATPALRRIGGG
ncbi:MAG: hypothetical protein AABY83_15270 [Pseudomonadota bacterium]